MDSHRFRPPVLVGERVVWLGSGSGIPQGGVVKWIGRLPEMGPDWTIGMELDNQLPYGGIDGTWGNRHLFTCKPKHGMLVPIATTLRERDLYRQRSTVLPESTLQHGKRGAAKNHTARSEQPSLSQLPQLQQEPLPQQQQQQQQQQQPQQQQQQQQYQPRQHPEPLQQKSPPPEPPQQQQQQRQESEAPPSSPLHHHQQQQQQQQQPEPEPEPEPQLQPLPESPVPISAAENDQPPVTRDPQPAQRRKKRALPQRPTRAKVSGTTRRRDTETNEEQTQPLPSNRYDTLASVTSGDYKWYDASEDIANDLVICKSSSYETVQVTSGIVQVNKSGSAVRASSENDICKDVRVQSKIMNNLSDSDFAYEQTVAVNDISETYKTNSFVRSSSSSQTGSGSRKEKTNSGFFSFLRWFRKSKDDYDDDAKCGDFVDGIVTPTATAPSSPDLVRSQNSSCGSIDTLFSTATVSSFSFVAPTHYRPFGSASQPEKCIAVGADTDTYRNRLRYRDRARELDKNLTLKKKYRLYASDSLSTVTTPNSSPLLQPRHNDIVQTDVTVREQRKVNLTPSPGSHNSTFGRKKRRAPPPPNLPKAQYSDYSLPSTLESKAKLTYGNGSVNSDEVASVIRTHHRRCASESSKDKKAGAYCHVKGKRKAPSPPKPSSDVDQANRGTLEKFRSPVNSVGRKKRLAPLPPGVNGKEEVNRRKVNKETQSGQHQDSANKTTINNLSPAERDRLISNIAKLKAHADRRSMGSPPSSPHLDFRSSVQHEQVVCNDTLKLERGVLKSNREMPKVEPPVGIAMEVKVAPVSPRPWYKRSLTKSDSSGSGGGILKMDIFKSLEKKKERDKDKDDDWIPEGGIARSSFVSTTTEASSSIISNRFNIFSRLDRSDDKKKDSEKRKSQISMLANISELDREAAEIVQKEQARETALMEAHHAQFYSYPDMPGGDKAVVDNTEDDSEDSPKRSSARELISLFNAIGHVTRVTVNTSFFKDGTSIFSKEGIEKRFSFAGDSGKTTEEKIIITETKTGGVTTSPLGSPGVRRRANSQNMTSCGVTITEVEDETEKTSKARALYEANKSRRHRSPSPSFPTIAEQSESVSSVATTPASTINGPKSNRDSGHGDVDVTKQSWICPRCTLENPRWKITCDACGRWRPMASEKIDAKDADEAVERPTSPVPFIDEEKTKVADKKQEQVNKAKTAINWEEELKRYLPDAKTPTGSPKLGPVRKKIESETKPQGTIHENGVELKTSLAVKTASSTQTEIKKASLSVKTTEEVVVKKTVGVGLPSNFIGGKLKQDEKKCATKHVDQTPLKAETVVVVGSEGPTIEETDVDELRKARLAFFHRAPDRNSAIISEGIQADTEAADPAKKPIDENERYKLREMLKEMRNSLPKRPKNNGSQESNNDVRKSVNLDNSDIFKQIEISSISVNRNSYVKEDMQQQGAVKKVPLVKKQEEPQPSTPVRGNAQEIKTSAQSGKAEALFVTKTTVYENIKMKKTDGSKPLKVSTSAQTSGVVRKIEPSVNKPPSGRPLPSDPNHPPLGEDYSYAGIKDGVLYMSLNKEARRIGKGTFELIPPRDFKSIEVVKAGLEHVATHVYANMPSSPDTTPNSARVLTQQPSAPTLEDVVATPSPEYPRVVSPLCVVAAHEVIASPLSPQSGLESSDQWSSATESPVPPSPRGSRRGGSATSEASSYSVASTRSGDTSEVERLTAQLTLPKGLADFKATLQSASPEKNMNTLSVNRLLRRLEAAIAGGQHTQAAGLAKELARLKISCSVTRQRRSLDSSPAAITVDMYVEDKVSHQGPLPLQVTPTMTVAQLKLKVEQEFEIPAGVQRWILGKILASDDSKTLEDHNVNSNGCPMFLYLVAPEGDQESETGSVAGNVENPEQQVDVEVASLPAPPGKGWYFNYEEDHYSYCETSDEDDISEEEMEEMRVHDPPKEEASPHPQTKTEVPVLEEEEEEEEDEDDDEEYEEVDEDGAGAGAVAGAAPKAHVVVVNDKPVVIQDAGPPPPKQDAQPARAAQPDNARAAAVERIADALRVVAQPKPENSTGTLRHGWQCPVCTLMNSPTRPGCAACTTERPVNYVVPTGHRASQQEMQRMHREQQVDEDMQQATVAEKQKEAEQQHQHYLQLVNLDKADLVPNLEAFDCSVCLAPYPPNDGVVLRECLHTFCKPCLVNTVQFSEEAEVQCPFRDANYACVSVLQDREIKALVPPNVYEQHLAKSVTQAENKIRNAFHCKTPDCRGWCIFEDNLNEFRCPVCLKNNCLTCQAIHDGLNCRQYQEHVKQESETNAEARRTNDLLEEMVERGEAMKCPTCHVVLMKKWGCDWLRCSMCKTEICWVTRGPRWGSGGKGDTTGGCQCGLNGIKCHPKCNYCH